MDGVDGWAFERSGLDWVGRNVATNRRTALKGTEQAAKADAGAGAMSADNGQNARIETQTRVPERLNSNDK